MAHSRTVVGSAALLVVALLACNKSKAQTAKEVAELKAATPVEVDPATLHKMFRFDSDYTDLQRDEMEKQIKGRVIEWKGMSVYEVSKSGSCYRIQTESGASSFPGSTIKACPPEGITDQLAASLQTGSMINVKAKIDGVLLRSIELEPAIVATFQ